MAINPLNRKNIKISIGIGIFLSILAFFFIPNLDINTLKVIYLNRDQSLDETFRIITNLAYPIVFSIPVFVLIKGLIKKEIITIQNMLYVIISIFVAVVIVTLFKYGFNRTRPFIIYDYLEKTKESLSPSFPSGHTTLTFAMVATLVNVYKKWFLKLILFIWAILVGYSRLHLGLHYPSDVLGGIIIGVSSALLCYKMRQNLINKKKLLLSSDFKPL